MSTPDGLTTPWQQYDFRLPQYKFMKPQGPHMPLTESSVCIPPALVIRDNEGAKWALGYDYSYTEWLSGKYEYDVVRNGVKTGEFARNIEFIVPPNGNRRVVRIWGADGWRTWNGRRFV